jgi:hypothetical protein
MKTGYILALLSLVSLHADAQTPACEELESRLRAEISTANACGQKYQACLALGPTNPMRELNYCQNLLKKCESLDDPIEDESLNTQVEQYKKQCS